MAPHLAGPTVRSILEHHGHETRLRDLNAVFYNTVLTPGFLYQTVKEAFDKFERNAEAVLRRSSDEAYLNCQPVDIQEQAARYRAIHAMAEQNEYRQIIRRIDWAVGVTRDREAFYDPAQLDEALELIEKACGILSATHHPSRLYFLHPNIKLYFSVESLQAHCENAEGNIFHAFFSSLLPDLLAENPVFIGISIGDYSQLLGGLTLALLLKRAGCAHVCIGGNLFGRHTDVLVNNPEFFRVFADSVVYNEGERPVLELLRRLEAGERLDGTPNLMHLGADGNIVINEEASPLPVAELFPPEFSDLKAEDYFLPEMIYNVQASRNCYWGKCSFCTHYFGSRYAVKSVEKMVDELRYVQQSYGGRHFHFVDEAMSPAYLERLSLAILDAGLDIRFYIYARFEKAFDRSVFQLAHRAGLRLVLWGFESASERVYRLMNKGKLAGKEERLRVLQDAYAEGVWNFCFLMFDFPTETLVEAKETVDFVHDHWDILSHSLGGSFMLMEDSPMLANLDKYAITKAERVRAGFGFTYRYTASKGKSAEENNILNAYKTDVWGGEARKFRGSCFREKLFLYVCRFGVEGVSRMNKEMWL